MTLNELINNLEEIREDMGGGLSVAYSRDTGPVEIEGVFISKSSDGVGIYVELSK